MKDATAHEILERMLKAIDSTVDADLARAIKVSAQAVSEARRKEKVPAAWAIVLASKYQVSLDWLLLGRAPEPQEVGGILPSHEEGRLAALEDERRELNAENRQLHRENAGLLKEIADLRERIARLEEQAIALKTQCKGGVMDTAVPASAPSAPSTNLNNDRA